MKKHIWDSPYYEEVLLPLKRKYWGDPLFRNQDGSGHLNFEYLLMREADLFEPIYRWDATNVVIGFQSKEADPKVFFWNERNSGSDLDQFAIEYFCYLGEYAKTPAGVSGVDFVHYLSPFDCGLAFLGARS